MKSSELADLTAHFHRLEACKLALEHALRVHAGDELGLEIIDSIERHVHLEQVPEPPQGYSARELLRGWRIPT